MSNTITQVTATGTYKASIHQVENISLITVSPVSGNAYSGLTYQVQGSQDGVNFFPLVAVGEADGIVYPGTSVLSPSNGSVLTFKVPSEGLNYIAVNVLTITGGAQFQFLSTQQAFPLAVNVGYSVGSAITSSGALTVTSSGAQALAVGANGTTNPVLSVNANTASVATGVLVTGAAAGGGVAIAATSSGTNESLKENAKGSGTITIGGISTGLVSIGRGSTNVAIFSSTKTSIATQNSTPTAAQLLGGYIQHASTTGSGTATLDTAANIDTAISGVTTGDSFECIYSNTGTQTVTITAGTGLTLKGTVAIPSGKAAVMYFFRTGTAAYDVAIVVSA